MRVDTDACVAADFFAGAFFGADFFAGAFFGTDFFTGARFAPDFAPDDFAAAFFAVVEERGAIVARLTVPRSAGVTQFATKFVDLVPQTGGVLEAEIDRGLVHLLLEGLDQTGDLPLGQ